jgi:uncharacterized membrane protein YagU involved in acid resistance
VNPVLAAAVAGCLATGPMTAVMSGLFRRLPAGERHPLPPRLVTERLLGPLGLLDGVPEDRRADAALAAHYAYGALTGAGYPLAARVLGGPPVVAGAAYGVAVWAASYLGWIPATGTLTPATRHSRRRNAMMIAAHLVWGGATAALAQTLCARPSGFGAPHGATAPVSPALPEIPEPEAVRMRAW